MVGVHIGGDGLGLCAHGGNGGDKRHSRQHGDQRRRPAGRATAYTGIENRGQAAFELRWASHGHGRPPESRLHGARYAEQVAGVVGGACAGSKNQVVGGALALTQELAPGDPGQRIPPVQDQRQASQQLRGGVGARHVPQLMQQDDAQARGAPGFGARWQ